MQELSGRVAVVTGGGSGIGRGICQALAEQGAHLVIADLDEASAEETAAIARYFAIRALAVKADVADPASMQAVARRAIEEFGAVHILCNNAGVIINGPVADVSITDWRWLFSVNVEGIVNGVQAFLPHLRGADGEAHIVNTSSIAGLAPLDSNGLGCYSATKAAIAAYSEVLRAELAPEGIGVSVLLPGRVAGTRLSESRRHRPAEFGGPEVVQSSSERISQARAAGLDFMEPLEVGRKVVAGIRANRVYIAADPRRKDAPEGRFARILADFDASAADDAMAGK